jgi:hypothetical protein
MDNLNETIKIAAELSEKMNALMRVYQKSVASLPVEQRKHLQVITDDINKMVKCIESGDLSALQIMMNKYASTDSVSSVL